MEKNRILTLFFFKGGSSIKKYCQNVRNRNLAKVTFNSLKLPNNQKAKLQTRT